MGQLAGKEAGVEIARPAEDPSSDRLWGDLYFRRDAVGRTRVLRLARRTALHLASFFMGEIPNPAAEFTPDHFGFPGPNYFASFSGNGRGPVEGRAGNGRHDTLQRYPTADVGQSRKHRRW